MSSLRTGLKLWYLSLGLYFIRLESKNFLSCINLNPGPWWGLTVKGFVSSGPPHLSLSFSLLQKSYMDLYNWLISTVRHKSKLCSSFWSQQRQTEISHGGATGVHEIHQCLHSSATHQRVQSNSLNYRQQVCGHAPGGSRLPTRLTPEPPEEEEKQRKRVTARPDKLQNQQTRHQQQDSRALMSWLPDSSIFQMQSKLENIYTVKDKTTLLYANSFDLYQP